MKQYLLVSGCAFALLAAAHAARLAAEGPQLVTSPTFTLTSIFSIAMTVWTWRLYRAQSVAPDSHT